MTITKEGELPWLKLILALALISGAIWAPLPLDSNRPELSVVSTSMQSLQNIDLQLWQDPFLVLAKQKNESDCITVSEIESKDALKLEKNQCASDERTLEKLAAIIHPGQPASSPIKTTLMQIMAAGDNSSGNQEHRRRMRYAVVSALKAQNYLPEDNTHLGLLTLKPSPDGESNGCNPALKTIPFEFFHTEDGLSRVLLLWINEEALLDTPFAASHSNNPVQCLEAMRKTLNPSHHMLIGPASSYGLQMLRDAFNTPEAKDVHFKIYSPFATYHHKYNPRSYIDNTIATDADVISLLEKELDNRDLKLSPHTGYAVIGQWDTDYARGLQKTFLEKMGPHYQKNIFSYHFMRGIDGKTPKIANNEEKQTDNKTKNPEAKIERPEGDTQIDYLRRIAADLFQQDQYLSAQCSLSERWNRNCGIRAIAMFGNDYYDKLLILKALKPIFPNTLFFTTDLEAAMLHPSDNKYTRNLIVASSYGLELGFEQTQKHALLSANTPPFREHYQTAVFLSVRKAICEATSTLQDPACQAIEQYQINPFVFEIGSNRPILVQSQTWPEQPFSWLGILMLLAAILTIMAWSWWRFGVKLHYSSKEILVHTDGKKVSSLCIADLLKLLAVLTPLVLLLALIGSDIRNHGEPFVLTEGVSIWPSEFMRLVACVASILLWQRVKNKIRSNLAEAHRGFFLFMPRNHPLKQQWKAHILNCRISHIRERAMIHTAFMLAVVFFLMGGLGFPNIPARSSLAKALDMGITLLAVSSCLFLIFSVAIYTVYTTNFFKLLINRTQWSDALLDKYGLQKNQKYPFYDWIDLQLIARITEFSGTMILYPVLPLLLLIGARSSIFEAWDMPVALLIVFAASFAILLIHGWLLRNKVEKARDRALYWIKRRMVQLEGEAEASAENRAILSQAKAVLTAMENLNTGAFAPISQQPTIQALFIIITGISGLKITEYFAITQL